MPNSELEGAGRMEVLRFRISEAEGLAWSTGIKVYTPMTREANGRKEDEEAVQSNMPTRRARESGHSGYKLHFASACQANVGRVTILNWNS